MRRASKKLSFSCAATAAALVAATSSGAPRRVWIPIKCSRGSDAQSLDMMVTVPATQAAGTRYVVVIAGRPTEKVSHFGLNYIHDQGVDYLLPAGARYVEGSARFLPDTGTPNVRAGARVWHDASGIHTLLPGRVDNGSGFTPPVLEFQLDVVAAAGTSVPIKVDQYRVTANAFLVGDLRTTCSPEPRPYVIGTTLVTPEPSPPSPNGGP